MVNVVSGEQIGTARSNVTPVQKVIDMMEDMKEKGQLRHFSWAMW
jgi:hypothetical protein